MNNWHSCGPTVKILYHPPIYDSETRSWKVDENGVLILDTSKPKLEFEHCPKCKMVVM